MIDYIKRLLSSDPGVSYARVSGGIVLFAMLTATAWTVWILKQPLPDLPSNWLTLILALYGVSKAGDVISTFSPVKKDIADGKD